MDDAIVIVEGSSYHIERDCRPRKPPSRRCGTDGPVMGITLALVAVFSPAGFLPGITGQIYSPVFAVIASTAVISAIKCPDAQARGSADLAEAPRESPPTGSQGFKQVVSGREDVYMGIVTRMVALPITIFFVLAAIITGGVLGISEPPDGFLPTETKASAS